MDITFENKRVLVTGAGQGIGAAIAKAFVKCKAEKVFALSKNKSNLDAVKAEVPAIEIIVADLCDWGASRAAVEAIGRIDILINNAGIAILEPFLQIKQETFDTMFTVNLKSIINVTQVAIKTMIESQKGGAIVNLSSQGSKIALWDHTVYSATKGALDAVTRAIALEFGQYNIRANAVNPTVVLTEMGRKVWADPKKSKPLLDRIPLHKFAEVEDIVNAVLFLSSDKAGMINAMTLPVEGGILSV